MLHFFSSGAEVRCILRMFCHLYIFMGVHNILNMRLFDRCVFSEPCAFSETESASCRKLAPRPRTRWSGSAWNKCPSDIVCIVSLHVHGLFMGAHVSLCILEKGGGGMEEGSLLRLKVLWYSSMFKHGLGILQSASLPPFSRERGRRPRGRERGPRQRALALVAWDTVWDTGFCG